MIDATCGRGKDTVHLAALVGRTGTVFALDIQESAIAQTRERIEGEVPPDERPAMHYVLGTHAKFPSGVEPGSVSAIIYNLGYLPGEGAERSIVTRRESTIQSLQSGLPLMRVGGLITMTTYVQQDGGADEEQAILDLTCDLNAKLWTVKLMQWINRDTAPSLVAIERLR